MNLILTDRTVLWNRLVCGDLSVCHLQKGKATLLRTVKKTNKPKN